MEGRHPPLLLSRAGRGGLTMLRRFELYSLAPDAPADKVAAMCKSMLDAQLYIPEVLHSAVGTNRSPVGIHISWEHAYASPEAYQRYMIHPFHANIYDRYLLNDSPERIVTNNEYDVGLLGYSCDTPIYFLPPGSARRLV
ncbi:MAG: Dabb family protein, partial [Verrucomicrobiaceae bacterium]